MNRVSGRQATCLLLVVLGGWSLTMTAADGRDGWIALALACGCSLPLTALCCLPAERMPRTRWFDLPAAAFGVGWGTAYLATLSALAFCSLCMSVLGGVIFLRTVSGGQWPVWLLAAAVLLCAAAAAQGERLALWTEPVVWVVVAALAVSLLLSVRQLDLSQLWPVLSDGWRGVPARAYLLLSAPFGEVFYAAAVLGGTGGRTRTGLLRACVLAGVLLCLLYVRNICLLGEAGAQAVLYPSYTAASVLEFGESFQRGEALISGSLIVCTVARAALLLDFFAGSLQTATGRCSARQAVWGAAAAAGAVCVFAAGGNRAFADALHLYQLLLLPIVGAAALALAAGVWLRTRK